MDMDFDDKDAAIRYQNGLIEKIKEHLELTQDSELAEQLGISPSDFGNRKRRGTLIRPLHRLAKRVEMKLEDSVTVQVGMVAGTDAAIALTREEALHLTLLRQLGAKRKQAILDATKDGWVAEQTERSESG